ncbi:hypothetical protein J1605_011583 [Eschrichtius robustus]|uniref:Uncharacterized protein n=1 Tax=Eschrichtius robustus TaxID=9764 RepID=A0AB34GPF3_ESCRO|nr:hypothetical protein J1605_011583 [Eschrichtius robustus]
MFFLLCALTGGVLSNLLSAFRDVLVGVLVGIVLGMFTRYFPSRDQAVLGPLALERARISAPHLEPYSKDVMTIAFLAILITAPNGALIIGILGPKVLTRHDPNKMKVELAGLELH